METSGGQSYCDTDGKWVDEPDDLKLIVTYTYKCSKGHSFKRTEQ
jgi:hypothetical protein